ncbi:F-box/LRR-repeat protein 4-like [Lycium barbarum]|uniref:F-box/LRR-repeat protein 4-like n=1 Tax=Lycium barbarum TaxID=112863 RepID=UPI00293ED6C7|nr:F-box/LRR-repeat protein 4-like [Lycium barbarum]
MEKLGDDLLALIMSRIDDSAYRKSISQVSKQWFRVEGLTRSSLRVFEPNLLINFLSRFPNLLKFESSEEITNTHLQILAEKCPRIQVLNLNFKKKNRFYDENLVLDDDFDEKGLSFIAKGCSCLNTVCLRKRSGVGDDGVAFLVKFLPKLLTLDLSFCDKVSDEALRVIGSVSSSLKNLNLQGCWLVSDTGLKSLAEGPVRMTLKKLILAECDRITDCAVLSLMKLCCLEELDLGECGPNVTDVAGEAIASSETVKRLNLSWLVNVSDATVVALAEGCKNLNALNLTGCEFVTGEGVCTLTKHRSLKELVLTSCEKLSGYDLEELVLGCQTLEHIVVDRRLRFWFPMEVQDNIMRQYCWIDWK